VSDTLLNGLTCTPSQPATLAVGDSMTCTGTHTVTQIDVDRGVITNVASATGKDPQGGTLSGADAATISAASTGHLTISKTATETSYAAPGDVIHYTITVTNDGTSTLSDVTVSDPTLPGLACAPAEPATLAPGARMTCTGARTVTQADVDRGSVTNVAAAKGTDPQGTDHTATDSATVKGRQTNHLTLAKSAHQASFDHVGQTLTYTLTATNDGTTTLTGVTIVDATLGGLTCQPNQPATLQPGGTLTCTGSYDVRQSDLDRGSVTNRAAVAGKDPAGATITAGDSATVTAVRTPHVSLAKTVAESSFSAVGDVLHYTITATNDGNVTLHDVTITDPLLPTLACTPPQPATLAPGDVLTCTGTHTVTQADLSAGSVRNTATVNGTDPGGVIVSDTTSASSGVGPQPPAPQIHIVKTPSVTILPPGGGPVTYTYKVTNPGTVAIMNVRVVDNRCSPVTFVGGDANANGALDPGETWTYTCTTRITATTTNTATATGSSNGSAASDRSSATVTVRPGPTPTPTPSPTASPSPSPTASPSPTNTPRPTVSPSRSPTPKPSGSVQPTATIPTPPLVTLPPTDSLPGLPGGTGNPTLLLVGALLLFAAGVLYVTRARLRPH
jgi:uncharacterized repeat protein (TIGR01451 family)